MKYVILDDDPDYLTIIKDQLELWGHQVYVTTDYHDAERMVFEHNPDDVLVDVLIPGHNGIDFIRKVSKASHATFWVLAGDIEHPNVTGKLSEGSLVFGGIVLKQDLLSGLKKVSDYGKRRGTEVHS